MPGTPPPLWPGYDDASEDDLLSLLDGKVDAAHDPNDETVDPLVSGALASAIARHESIKKRLDPDNYRPRLHETASKIAGSWKP